MRAAFIALLLVTACGTAEPEPLDRDAGSTDSGVASDAGLCIAQAGACSQGSICCGGLRCIGFNGRPPICTPQSGCIDDGVANGAETGVDCGNGCGPCPLNEGCSTTNDCAASLYCSRNTSTCVGAPTGASCTPGSTVIGLGDPRQNFSPDSPECSGTDVCVFGTGDECVIWPACMMNQFECCDVNGIGTCFPSGQQVPCNPPQGNCGPQPK